MNKKMVCIIICIILVIVIIFLVKNSMYKENLTSVTIENNTNEENIIEDDEQSQNLTEENIVETQNIIENVSNNVDNSTTVSTIQNAVVQDNLISSPEKNAYESEKDLGSTNKKQEAINMVKEYWGEDDSVTFSCDSVTSNGEYIIAVVSKNSASVSGYFRVNLEKKTVEVDY